MLEKAGTSEVTSGGSYDFRDARTFIVKCGEAQLHAVKSVDASMKREAGQPACP